jgi:hypothetical protein
MVVSAEEAAPGFVTEAEEAGMVAAADRCAPKKCERPKPKCAKPKPKCVPQKPKRCERPKPKCPPPKPKCPPRKKIVYCEDECNPTKWSFQARGAAYLPLRSQIRQIYGSALPTVEFETSYRLCQWSNCNQLLLWWNAGWTFQTGRTIGFKYHTRLNMVPVSLGIEYQVNICRNVDFYFGAGPTYSFLLIEDKDGFTTQHIYSSQFGATGKTGFRFTFCTNFFFDLFGDFFYTPFGQMRDSIQSFNGSFSGFFVGAGFGGKW